MSAISSIRFIPLSVSLPQGKAYGMAKSLATARQTTLVVVETRSGVTGIGEAWGSPAVNETYLPLLAGYLKDCDLADIELVFSRIVAGHYHFGLQNQLMACISGIDIAAKDALGKETGLPVCRLIGGRGLHGRWRRCLLLLLLLLSLRNAKRKRRGDDECCGHSSMPPGSSRLFARQRAVQLGFPIN